MYLLIELNRHSYKGVIHPVDIVLKYSCALSTVVFIHIVLKYSCALSTVVLIHIVLKYSCALSSVVLIHTSVL